jgi:hypothetical protein
MRLQNIKVVLAVVWVISATVIGLAAGVTSAGGRVALAALGLLPPIALLYLWNDPTQTMSESINKARR